MTTNYHIAVMDWSGDTVDIVDTTRCRMEYTLKLNAVGRLIMTFWNPDDRARTYKNRLDYLYEVYRDNVKEGTFLRRFLDDSENDGAQTLILGAEHLHHFLARRQIDPDDDPAGAGGYSTKGGYAQRVMHEYVEEQCVNPLVNLDRRIAGLYVPAPINAGNLTYQRRRQEDNLLDVLQDIADGTKYDFSITHEGGAVFRFQGGMVGSDKSKETNYPFNPFLLFKPMRGNMQQPRLVIDRYKEKNFIYVGEEGPDEDKEYVPVSDPSAIGDSPWNRCEGVVDAQGESVDEILSTGAAELEANKAETDFSFEPVLTVSGAKYSDDWVLGDIVSVEWDDFTERARVTEVHVIVSDEGEQIIPKIEKYD